MRLTKQEKQMIEGIDPWYEDGQIVSYQVFLNKGWVFMGEDGGSFCEDTMAEVKETLKRVTRAA